MPFGNSADLTRNQIDKFRGIVDFPLADYNMLHTCTVQFASKRATDKSQNLQGGNSNATTFPITYFQDELAELPQLTGPLHWHPVFELASVEFSILEYQVGQQRILLEPGDSIFINGNVLHGVKQLDGNQTDPMPNIVFPGSAIAPENSIIFQKYIKPIALCDQLPFVVFRHNDLKQNI